FLLKNVNLSDRLINQMIRLIKKLNHLSLQSIFHFRLSLLKKWFKKIQLFQTGFHNVETL
ncbi:TPA: hypothetical protein ACGO40_000186, partial [Streptococcus suis]